MEKFKAGDRVRLKSGGPIMTVSSHAPGIREKYVCQWFAGQRLEHGKFEASDLELVESPPGVERL